MGNIAHVNKSKEKFYNLTNQQVQKINREDELNKRFRIAGEHRRLIHLMMMEHEEYMQELEKMIQAKGE